MYIYLILLVFFVSMELGFYFSGKNCIKIKILLMDIIFFGESKLLVIIEFLILNMLE